MQETYPRETFKIQLLVIIGIFREAMDVRAYREESYDEIYPMQATRLEENGSRERGSRPRYLVLESQIAALRQGGFRWEKKFSPMGMSLAAILRNVNREIPT